MLRITGSDGKITIGIKVEYINKKLVYFNEYDPDLVLTLDNNRNLIVGGPQADSYLVVKNYLFYTVLEAAYQPETIDAMTAIGIADNNTTIAIGSPNITGHAAWLAVDKHFVELKNILVLPLGVNNLSTYAKSIYLFAGGSAAMHKWNAAKPINNTPSFRLDFYGGIVHDINGAKFNGSNGFADTNMSPILTYPGEYHAVFQYRKLYTLGCPWGGSHTAINGRNLEWPTINIASMGNLSVTVTPYYNGNIALMRNNGTEFNYLLNGVNQVVAETFNSHPNSNIMIGSFYLGGNTGYSDANVRYHADFKSTTMTVSQAQQIQQSIADLQTAFNRA